MLVAWSAVGDLAEDRVLGRELVTDVHQVDEELAAVRVRPAGIRHHHDVLVVAEAGRRGLDREPIARPAGPKLVEDAVVLLGLRVTSLDHEARNDPMERDPVVEAAAGQCGEVGRRDRGLVACGRSDCS